VTGANASLIGACAALFAVFLLSAQLSAFIALRLGESRGAKRLALLMAAIALWSGLNALEYLVPGLQAKLILANIQYAAIVSIGPLWFGFAAKPEGRGGRRAKLHALLWILPAATAALVWLDPSLGLVRRSIRLEPYGDFLLIAKEFGPWFWVHSAYSYILVLAGALAFLRDAMRERAGRTPRIAFIAVAAFLPIAANVLYVFRLAPLPLLDPTPLAFLGSGLIVLLNLGRLRSMALISAARAVTADTLSDPVLSADTEGRLVYANAAARECLGIAEADMGRPLSGLGAPLDGLAGMRSGQELEILGSPMPLGSPGALGMTRFEARAVDVSNGKHRMGLVISMHDVTRRQAAEAALMDANRVLEAKVAERTKALEESAFRMSIELESRLRSERQLYHDALHDPLTGLANRSLLLSRVEQAIARSRRAGDDPFGLLYVNFDGFLGEQGDFGHEVEDAFLREAAARIKRCVREPDTVARIRGDEFAVLLDGEADPVLLEKIAETMSDELSVPYSFGAGSVVPRASIGILSGGSDCGSAQEALRDADIAMHFAKAMGTNKRAIFAEEMRRMTFERNRLMNDLRSAIVTGGISLAFQPIVDMLGRSAGWECLARWTHAELGPIGPDRFIPLAEESGLIAPLGTYVLIEALRTAKSMLDEGLIREDGERTPFFAVNISAHQLRQSDFPDLVLAAIGRAGVPPRMLHLELTESALIEERDTVMEVLDKLSRAGIHFKLDDFGTGYSSLNSLHRIPIDSVKIDKSFIQRIVAPPAGDPRAAGMVRGIVSLGHELGKSVVAEGVETAYQAETLRALGCDYAQGFFYGSAIRADELRASLGSAKEAPVGSVGGG
jgi:diguanylate cyclase (GGDEF)-like protein